VIDSTQSYQTQAQVPPHRHHRRHSQHAGHSQHSAQTQHTGHSEHAHHSQHAGHSQHTQHTGHAHHSSHTEPHEQDGVGLSDSAKRVHQHGEGGHAASTPGGQQLAHDARQVAETGAARIPGHYRCYAGVKMALSHLGVKLTGSSAYQAAPQLAQNPNFHEAEGISRDNLRDLPQGAVVVWNRNPAAGKAYDDGHISVALGNGQEASDRIRPQTHSFPSSYRVFMPGSSLG
jgi:hypothetical protein